MMIIKKGKELDAKEQGEASPERLRTRKVLLLLLAIAFLLRLFLVLQPEVIHNDGTEYIRHARQILSGDWRGGKVPPLYPFLIAIFHFCTSNDELAGIWASIFFGTLVVLPVFYLGKEIFNEKVGTIAALFAVVHPFLYMSSGSVLTESTYHFFLATSVLFGWNAFSKGRFYNILLFSLFATFAYLTRPEAIGFLFIFCIWVLLIKPPFGKRSWTRRAGIVLLTIFCFLAFSFPYLIQIRKESGRWGISRKIFISTGTFSKEERVPPIEEIRRKKEFPLLSLISDPLTALRKIGIGFLESLYKFQQGLHPFLFFLAIVGLIASLKKESPYPLKGNFYLMTYLVFFFGFVFPFFWVTRRYTSQMITIALPWAAFGFLASVEWFYKRLKWGVSQTKFGNILLIFILLGLAIQGSMTHSREFRFIQREVGLWMKEHLPREGKIMSSLPQEAFYAGLPWVHMPSGSYEEILEAARSQGVRYLVIDEKIEKDSPDFWKKSKEGNLSPLLDLRRKDRRMVVFQVDYR